MAITGGLASVAAALWVRDRVMKEYQSVAPVPSFRFRLVKRAPYVVASALFVGVAAATSGTFDRIEGRFFNHHDLHNLPFMCILGAAARFVKKNVNRLAEKAMIASSFGSHRVHQVVIALNDLTGFILGGALAGVITHIFSDLPNSGRGMTALCLLKPFSNRPFDLKMGLHDNLIINDIAMKIGVGLTIGGWSIILLYVSTRTLPEVTAKEAFADLRAYLAAIDAPNELRSRVEPLLAGSDRNSTEIDLHGRRHNHIQRISSVRIPRRFDLRLGIIRTFSNLQKRC